MPAEHINTSPDLAELMRGIADAPALPLNGIASDSRKIAAGYLFLACPGIAGHGMDYVDQAIERGAAVVAFDSDTATAPANPVVPMIGVAGLARFLGEIANRWYGNPSQQLSVVGVTGTNGKTTVAWMIAQCLQRLDKVCAYAGTLGIGVDELEMIDGMTTAAAVELHGDLASFVDAGASHAALEVSSHALAQSRVDGVTFAAAMFTNLTRDHLDYHGDMQAYFDAKARLFLDYSPAVRIINLDSEFGTELAARCGQDVITVSTNFDRVANGRPYVFVRSVVASNRGSDISFVSSWGDGRFELPMPGDFNVANAALVLAYLLSAGIALDDACNALQAVDSPPGRMERVADSNVFVDYAHTPDAIESALRALRPHCRGKLWCVFGCGGDRDAGKRPQMGKLAERRADHLVITSDNPRTEDPTRIINDIVAGLSGDATVIEDRAAAISWAIHNAAENDLVLIAGKGHEDYQDLGRERLPFSDFAVALAALGEEGVE